MSRRTLYYKASKNEPKINPILEDKIKGFIDKYPEAGYRTAAWMLGLNKNTVQRVFQIKGWQVRKIQKGFCQRVKAYPSVTMQPNQRNKMKRKSGSEIAVAYSFNIICPSSDSDIGISHLIFYKHTLAAHQTHGKTDPKISKTTLQILQ